ncbi:hypothetical protein INT46_000793 [Mucor plumbeus]|uniref:Uncharacterized protein n=1 Tax=Mucor plumbeus TaxID=97098 RepID=A0A8H7RG17_9FUNG|nr:hypothetical protein INT46_000793 [Mucor plumbeus]
MTVTRKLFTPSDQPSIKSVAAALPNTSRSISPPGVSQVGEDETIADAKPSKALNGTEQDVITLTQRSTSLLWKLLLVPKPF